MANYKPGVPTPSIAILSLIYTILTTSPIQNPALAFGSFMGTTVILIGIRFTYLKVKKYATS